MRPSAARHRRVPEVGPKSPFGTRCTPVSCKTGPERHFGTQKSPKAHRSADSRAIGDGINRRAAAGAAFALLTSLAFLVAGHGLTAAAAPCPPFCSTTTAPTTTPTTTPHPTTSAPQPTTPPATVPPTPQTTPKATTPVRTTAPATSRGISPATVAPLAPTATVATTSTTTTTIAGIGGRLPPAPVTLPLTTKGSNAHVDPLLAWLSGIGFCVVILVIIGRFLTSRPKRTGARAGGGA
jgi:hypothetical protein